VPSIAVANLNHSNFGNHYMYRFSLLTVLFVTSCHKPPPQQEAGIATTLTVAPSVSVALPNEVPKLWYVGTWKGDFTVARHNSATSTKQGGPAAWEKDAGQTYSGAASASLHINPQGEASGTVKGALGELGMNGKIDDTTLRANLVARSDDPKAIQNGYVILTRDGESLKGRLDAASGDALVLRQSEVTLKRIDP
ncbi:MAG TPA: hypothetical protein VIV60_36270, partial [Polyangiaceae bacterium]